MHGYRARPDVTVLSDCLEVPGLGFLAVRLLFGVRDLHADLHANMHASPRSS